MNIQLTAMMTLCMGILSAQIEMNYSYEMKYGKDDTDYEYNEHLLDINVNYYPFSSYIQLEYSDPPLLGYNRTTPDSIINKVYIEYSGDNLNAKLGDISTFYGRGLSMNLYQDQTIDFDNSIRGFNMEYYYNNLMFFSIIGRGRFNYRFLPINKRPDLYIDNRLNFVGLNYTTPFNLEIQYSYKLLESRIPKDIIKTYWEFYQGNNIGTDLRSYVPGVDNFDILTSGISIDTINTNGHNISGAYYGNNLEIYLEQEIISYNRLLTSSLLGEMRELQGVLNIIKGRSFYSSIYTTIWDFGITYEFKNYDTPLYINTVSSPPILFREANSVLISRNSHSVDFSDETGHQLDINRRVFDHHNILFNFAFSQRHDTTGKNYSVFDLFNFAFSQRHDTTGKNYSVFDIMAMNPKEGYRELNPFRELYMEINGETWNEKAYYKAGIDYYKEFVSGPKKDISAITLPMQLSYKLMNRSAITIYYEIQQSIVDEYVTDYKPKNINEQYVSLSYSHLGSLIVTLFSDSEKSIWEPEDGSVVSKKFKSWNGLDITYKFSGSNQISLFYGSQKGGLVCANGVCAVQPDFENGFKITVRSLF